MICSIDKELKTILNFLLLSYTHSNRWNQLKKTNQNNKQNPINSKLKSYNKIKKFNNQRVKIKRNFCYMNFKSYGILLTK